MNLSDYLENNRLREVRIEKNLRQWQLGLMTSMSISRISQIEQGAPARNDEKEKLARALEVELARIWTKENH